jgi:hypothetical protein
MRPVWSMGMRLKIIREVRSAGTGGKNGVLRKYEILKHNYGAWLADEDAYRKLILEDPRNAVRARLPGAGAKPRHPDMEEKLSKWCVEMRGKGHRLTRRRIVKEARKLLPNDKGDLSEKWYGAFLRRSKLVKKADKRVSTKSRCEAAGMPPSPEPGACSTPDAGPTPVVQWRDVDHPLPLGSPSWDHTKTASPPGVGCTETPRRRKRQLPGVRRERAAAESKKAAEPHQKKKKERRILGEKLFGKKIGNVGNFGGKLGKKKL